MSFENSLKKGHLPIIVPSTKMASVTNFPSITKREKSQVRRNIISYNKLPTIQMANRWRYSLPQAVSRSRCDVTTKFDPVHSREVSSISRKVKLFKRNEAAGDDVIRKLPLTPEGAIERHRSSLTSFELKEILSFEEIWFVGSEAKKNDDRTFDDVTGSYVNILHDHLYYRYEILEVIGKGTFGQVVKAFDHKTNKLVAIKIIRNKKKFRQQAKIEVDILEELRNKDKKKKFNFIHIIDYFLFRRHMCIVFELFGTNLYEIMKMNNFKSFNLFYVRKISFNLLKFLCFLYSQNIIHCDLKPENILIENKNSSSLKVIDFGSSCRLKEKVYTYIQSRYYRSPEVILGCFYGKEIDIWSFACIIIELVIGQPIFCGENEVEQLACIMEVLGKPPIHLKQFSTRWDLFFDNHDEPRCIVNSRGRKRSPNSKSLQSILNTDNSSLINFLEKCLRWEPSKRMTPHEAIRHSWIRVSR